MVPPPSAVMQPSMQTPAQSMLRRPAASAAVIACAASATSDRKCSTLSLGGRFHMESSKHWKGFGTYGDSSTVNKPSFSEPPAARRGCLRLKEEPSHDQ